MDKQPENPDNPNNLEFHLKKSPADGTFYWHLKSKGNHKKIAYGKGYDTKQAALKSIGLVLSLKNAPVYDADGREVILHFTEIK